MAYLKIHIWEHREPQGEPDVEVKIPSSMSKWIPKMMRFVPRKTKDEVWGGDVDFDAMFADIDKMISDAQQGGTQELMTVRAKDTNIRIIIES